MKTLENVSIKNNSDKNVIYVYIIHVGERHTKIQSLFKVYVNQRLANGAYTLVCSVNVMLKPPINQGSGT